MNNAPLRCSVTSLSYFSVAYTLILSLSHDSFLLITFSLTPNPAFATTASTYLFIDLTMVAFMYTYMIYVLRLLGIFQYLQRKWHNFTFALHDHVLNFLMKKIRQTTLGFENIYVGVRLITQWDDLIAEQRRFHLLAWPRVDPPNIINTFNKLFEIKWAALWNLNIPTLRSSLGLSVLHTTVYSGDTDIARWIVYHYPQLLLAQDSSRDTPIAIGLKEAAFFALESSHLNEGRLDDGTSYGDEWFNQVNGCHPH